MTDLTGKLIANTYKDILTINSSATNEGLDNTLRRVQDGEGTNSSLKLSETSAAFTGNVSVNGNLTINGAFQPQNIQTSAVRATTVSATNITTNNLTAETLIFQDVSVSSLRTGNLYAANISAGTVSATNINATNITVDGDGVATSSALASVNDALVSVEALISSNIVFVLDAQASVLTVLAGLEATDVNLQNNINSVSTTVSAVNVQVGINATQINTLSTSITANASAIVVNSDAITSINSILGGDAFASVGTSATLETRIAGVSSTMATSIANVSSTLEARIAGVSTALASTSAALTSNINTVPPPVIANVSNAANSSQIAAVSATMATSINNSNTNITTNTQAITSINGVLGSGAFASAGTSATLETRIATVSSTMATSIGNQMPKAGGTFTGPVVFDADGFTINSNASAVFNGPARMNSDITLGNSSGDTIYGAGRWGTSLIPNSTTGRNLGNDSLRWDTAFINTFRGGIDSFLTSVGDINAGDNSSKPVNSSWVQDRLATKASVGTSATLETRIAAVSATMATSINNSNTNITTNTQAITSINGVLGSGAFASAGTSATLETRIAAVSATMATSINNSNTNITTNTQAITSINGVLGSGAFASAGTSATLQTKIASVSSTLATSIGNSNTNIAAVSVLTKTNKDAITSINGVLGDGSAYASAGTSATLETRIAAVSTTMATSINNSNTNIAAVSVLTKTNKDAITSINGVLGDGSAYASAGTSATLETRIAAVSSTMATSIGNQMPKAGGTFTGNVAFDSAISVGGQVHTTNGFKVSSSYPYLNFSETDTANLNSSLISNSGKFQLGTASNSFGSFVPRFEIDHSTGNANFSGNVTASAFYGDGSNLTGFAAKASVGTSATLETRIAAVSATMATSIGNSNSAITALSATMATSVATRLALAGGTMTGNLILNADPSANLQAASKQYVDNLTASSIHVHEAVRVETNGTNLNATYNNGSSGVGATLTNAGTQAALAIDDITLNTSDRVLVMGQTNQTQNGVYVVTNTGSGSTNWILTRSDDADTSGDGDANTLDEGSYFFVQEGTIGAAHAFVCNTQGTIVFGTTNINFAQFSDSVEYTAGTGINVNSSRVISTSGVATTGQLTTLSATMATSINNSNTNITTNAAAITSINGVLGSGAFASAGTSATLQTKINAVSATLATSIGNSNTNITTNANAITSINGVIAGGAFASAGTSATLQTKINAVSVLTSVNAAAITSINGIAYASAGTSATLQTKIAAVSSTMATSIGNKVAKAGDTMTGNLSFGDNDKAIFGAGTDLQIYHDGSNSAIQNATGELFVYGGGDQIRIRAENSKESIVANQNGPVDLYFNGVQKFETNSGGIAVEGIVSANRVRVSAVDINSASTKYRQYDMSTGSGGGSFLLGKIENNSSTNGAVSGKLYFAYDYGTTTDSATINFTFSQRSGAARGQWWYEHDDQDSVADRVSVKLIDDGAGGMFVWVVAADFATIAAETVWRSCESVTTSGQVTAGTITTGTTLFDTANDPTSEMHIGKLFAHSDINVDGNVTATAFYGDGSNLTGITITAASVGTSATLETRIAGVSATMATSISNSNTAITALSATMATSISNSNTNITTNANAITSINGVIAGGAFASAGTSATLQTKINAVSATMATSIGNQMPKAGGTFTGPVVFNADGFTVNSDASAVFNGPIRMNSSIRLGNGSSDLISGSGRWAADIIPNNSTSRDLGTDSLRWDNAYINTFRGGINAIGTSVTDLTYPSSSGNAPTNVNYVGTAIATKASVGTSATLETRIAAVSVTMATSIGNSNSAITALSATLATSISNYLPLAGGTVTGNVSFGDNDKAIFGAGSDLQIYHDGSNSYIVDNGTGDLLIRAENNLFLKRTNSDETYFSGAVNGAVTLFHNNNPKLATAISGIDVTGTVTADGLTVDTNTLHVDSTNNRVGIGTSSPARELSIGDGTGSPNIQLLAANTGNSRLEFGDTDDSDVGEIQYLHGDNAMLFHVNASERMRIDSSGNVLIGTDSGDGFNSDAALRLQKASGNNYVQIKTASSSQGGILIGDTNDDFVGGMIYNNSSNYLRFDSNNAEKMRLEGDGDLHVDGNVVAYSTTISDIRLKKDIAPIDNALWRVSQLNGCTFTYLKDDRKSAGLIAQDLEKVLPSAVIEDEAVFHGEEGETYKTVQYDQVIGLLVEAVKELTAKVEELENASTK